MATSKANQGRIQPLPELTVDQAVGRGVRALRLARGWTQTQVAQGMTIAELKGWRRTTVTSLEAGQRRIGLDEALALAHMFGVPVVDLLPLPTKPEGNRASWALRGPDDAAMPPDVARWHLTGGHEGVPDYTSRTEEGIFADHSPSFGDFLMERDDANASAARALGITVGDLLRLSRARWTGLTLPRERDRRLDALADSDHLSTRSRQARRGHVTRVLLDELRAALPKLSRPIAEYDDSDSDFQKLRAELGFPTPSKSPKKGSTE